MFVAIGSASLIGHFVYTSVFATNCVLEGTPIDTPDGLRPIEALHVGASVWTLGADGRRESGRVSAVHPSRARSWLEIAIEGGYVLQVTARHPIRVAEGWKEAGELRAGEEVVTLEGLRKVKAPRVREGDVRVFDLEIDPNPNFYAAGVLVHNKSRNDWNAAGGLKTIVSAQAEFRSLDWDRNGARDYWVADVSGLYTILAPGRDQGLQLIEVTVAYADANPRPNWGGTSTAPLGPLQSKAAYYYSALKFYEDEKGVSRPYDEGEGRHPSRFGFVAWPDPRWRGSNPTLIVSEKGTVYAKDLKGYGVDTFPHDPEARGWRPFP